MNKTRKSPAAVKVIACLLLLGSLAAFLLPWMKLSADTGPDRVRMTPGEILRNYLGLDESQVKALAREAMASEGARMEPEILEDLLDRGLDGRFRLVELPILCREAGDLCFALQEPDLGGTLTSASLIAWGAVGLLALLGLIALICQLSDHRGGILPYFLLGCLYTAGLLMLRREGNALLVQQSDALFAELGIGTLVGYLGIEAEMIKMGIGAYLCPFLALLALLLMGIRKKQPKKRFRASPYPARRSGEDPSASGPGAAPYARQLLPGWTCPACGGRMEADKRFCTRCGQERPRAPAAACCPVCGKRIPVGAAFCGSCGAAAPGGSFPGRQAPFGG